MEQDGCEGLGYKGRKGTFGGDEYIHYLGCDDLMHIYSFKYVQFIICQLYLNKAVIQTKKVE